LSINWRHYFIAASAIFVLASCSMTWAIKMEAVVGFGGLAGTRVWTPINVTIENDSAGEIPGTLEVTQQGLAGPASEEQVTICAPHVTLPSGAKKKYQVYVKLNDFGDTTVSLRSGYWVVAKVKPRVDYTSASSGSNDYTVVTVGGMDKRLSFLANETYRLPVSAIKSGMPGMPGMPAMPGSGGPQIQFKIGWIEQQNLPDKPAGFAAVDMLVLLDFTASAVSPEVINSMKMWVASGGTLVIPSGADYRKFQEPSFYGELLPVTVTGAGQAAGLPSVESICKSSPIGPIALARAVPISGRCTYSLQDSSGLVWGVRNYGAGRVVFLAFDPAAQPFRNWAGQTAFWKSLAGNPRMYPSSPALSLSMNQFMSNGYGGPSPALNPSASVSMNPAVKTPSPNIIWVFLGIYIIVLVPVNYTVLRMKNRLELAWVTFPAIVLFFTIGAYGIGYSVKGGQILLSQASIMVASVGSRMAGSISSGWVFSPARRGYTVELKDPVALASTTAENVGYGSYPGQESSPFPVASMGEKIVWDNVKMAMWSSQSFESEGGLDLGGTVDGHVSTSGTTMTGVITNNTKYNLKHCLLVYDSSSVDLGDISPGKTKNISMSMLIPKRPKGGIIAPPKMPGMGGGMGPGMPGMPGMSSMPSGAVAPGMYGVQSAQPTSNQVATRLRTSVESAARGANEPVLVADIDADPGYSISGVSPQANTASCIIIRF